MSSTHLVLVKHAMPVLDASRPPREWLLGEEGRGQSLRLAARLRAFAPMRLVASPEPKAHETGRIVAAELAAPVAVVPGLEEIDRPAMPLMSREEHERVNAAIFDDLDRPVLGAESGRGALARFSSAVASELARTEEPALVVITHGTVISLFVAARAGLDALGLWRRLACPSYVVMESRTLALAQVVADAGGSASSETG